MPIRRYRKDPRTPSERAADESARHLFDHGGFLGVDEATKRQASEHVQSRYQARRDTVAALGKELGLLRQAHGLTQEAVAVALGTKKSSISRLESGRYGGLTIEYFLAVVDAFRALDQAKTRAPRGQQPGARSGAPTKKVLQRPVEQIHTVREKLARDHGYGVRRTADAVRQDERKHPEQAVGRRAKRVASRKAS